MRVLGIVIAGLVEVSAVLAQVAPPAPPAPPVAPKMQINVAKESSSFLGVGIQEIDAERAKALKLREEAGVEVTKVYENSPASKAGLKEGDVIVDYNGSRIEGIEQFSRFVRETPVGRDVKLGVLRGGSQQTLTAKIAARSESSTLNGIIQRNLPDLAVRLPDLPRANMSWSSGLLGVEAESITGQLANFFGVRDGVLVRSVEKESAAEKAGIRAGDVIVKVDGAPVSSPSDVSAKVRAGRGKSFPIVVERDHKEVTLNVTIATTGGAQSFRDHASFPGGLVARTDVGYW